MNALRVFDTIKDDNIHVRDTDKEIFGRAVFALDRPFHYESQDKQLIVDIPQDFETDFASIPFLFWWFFPPIGKWKRCAVVHDYLYKTRIYDRWLADRVFLYDAKYSPIRMRLMWFALRLFGWLFFTSGNKKCNS